MFTVPLIESAYDANNQQSKLRTGKTSDQKTIIEFWEKIENGGHLLLSHVFGVNILRSIIGRAERAKNACWFSVLVQVNMHILV